jgi:hypothetical protein
LQEIKTYNGQGIEMSENQESEETLLPDDADRKIEELMAALRESEQDILGEELSAVEKAAAETNSEVEEEPLSDEEGDFVDLDAEQLDNSADKLLLDESDAVEEQLLDDLVAAVEPSAGEPLDSSAGEQHALEANERVQARFDELEQKLAAVEVSPQPLSPPPARPGETFPSRISAGLALLAVVLSGAALWFNFNAPLPQASGSSPNGIAAMQAQDLKMELASLRKRLNAVEQQVEQGGDETMAMLERMRNLLASMENKILSSAMIDAPVAEAVVALQPAAELVPVASEPDAVVQEGGTADTGGTVENIAAEATGKGTSKAHEGVTASVEGDNATPTGGVYVKGWAVNLRSYYHRMDAERLVQRYQKAGIDAQIREIPKGDATWHRVRVMGFGSKQEANAFIQGLSTDQGRDMAWPSYYQGYVDG